MGKPSKGTPADMRLKENQGKRPPGTKPPKSKGKAKGLGNTAFGPLNRQPMPKGAAVRPLKSAGG